MVVVSCLFYLCVVFLPYLSQGMMSNEAINLLLWRGYGAILPLPQGVFWLIVLLWIAAAVGMFNFSSAARVFYLILAVFGTSMSLLWGFNVQTALESFLASVAGTLDGAILAMAYFSPLKEEFEREQDDLAHEGRTDEKAGPN